MHGCSQKLIISVHELTTNVSCVRFVRSIGSYHMIGTCNQQARRAAQVQSVLKPVGPQQLSNSTSRPCLLADQSHTLLSEANLPVGSSSYAASTDVSCMSQYTHT